MFYIKVSSCVLTLSVVFEYIMICELLGLSAAFEYISCNVSGYPYMHVACC